MGGKNGRRTIDTLPLFDGIAKPEPPPRAVNQQRDEAMALVGENAERHRARFREEAELFVVRALHAGPQSGEALTLACKAAGITPHDDRAFGPVYMSLARRRIIHKVDTVRRERGHGTAGGNVWALTS